MPVAGEHGEAFVVCVDTYDHEDGANLAPARACAERFRELARGLGFTADEPVFSGTERQIDECLQRVEASNAPRKLVYWVGHGVGIGGNSVVLPCRDFRPGGRKGLFRASEIGHFLTCLTGDVLLIVDTCHATRFAHQAHQECLQREETSVPAGPDGPDGPGRSIGCLGTVGGGELAQVGAWVTALEQVCADRRVVYRDEKLWNPYTRALTAGSLLAAVRQQLRSTSLVEPELYGGSRLEGFFVNPYYDPFARPASAIAPSARQTLLGEQIQRLLKSRFTGLRLEEEDASFVGRRRSLARITHWLEAPGNTGVMVVTGPPGSGKSAVLAQAALMTIPSSRQFNRLTPAQRGRLSGALTAGIQCRGRSALECARELAAGMEVAEPASGWKDALDVVRSLIGACRDRGEAAFLVDGLDETDPAHLDGVITDVLRPLAQEPTVKILVSTRPTIDDSLLMLDGSGRLDLDDDPDKNRDIAEYVAERLKAPGSPYRDDDGLREAATRALVAKSRGVFLVARLHCSALTRLERALPPTDEEFRRILVSGLEQALDQEVDELDRVAEKATGPDTAIIPGWARGLLLPLALSYGAGLPQEDDIWLAAARELADLSGAGIRYTADDLRAVLKVAGAHIVVYGEAGQPVYRLAHEAMAEHLVKGAVPTERELHGATTDVLLRIHHARHRGRSSTNPYIARYASAHAAAAERLDELVRDGEFLVNADPERLTVLLDRLREETLPEATLYRGVAEELIGRSPAERAALLQSAALCQQPTLCAWARAAGGLFWEDKWTTAERSAPTRTLRVPYGDVQAVGAGPAGAGAGLLAAGEQLWRWPTLGGTPELLGHHVTARRRLGPNRLHALSSASRGLSVSVVAADAERILIWPASEVDLPWEFGWGAGIADVAVGGRGRTEIVVAASGRYVGMWEFLDGRARHRGFWTWPYHGQAYGVAVAELGSALYVVAVGDGGGVLWDASTGAPVYSFGKDGGRGAALAVVAVGDHPHVAVVGSTEPQLRVWRFEGRVPLRAERVHAARLRSPSGASVALGWWRGELLVAAVDGGAVRLWRVGDGAELPALTGHRSRPTSVAFLSDDRGTVVVADGTRIRVWEQMSAPRSTEKAGVRRGLPSPAHEHVGSMTATASGQGAVVLAARGTARVWDLTGGHLYDETALTHISSVDLRAVPHGGLWLAAGGRHEAEGPGLRVRNLTDGSTVALRLDAHHDTTVGAVALATGGDIVRVFAADDRYVRRWDVTTGEPLAACHVTTGMVEHLAVVEAPPGTSEASPFLLATAGDSVWVWDNAEPGEPLRFRLPGSGPARAVAGTHDRDGRRRVAVATSAGVFTGCLDEPVDENGRRVLHPLSRTVTDVHSLAFCTTASGQLVVLAACRRRTVHEWVLDRRPKDRPVTDRGYEVYGVLAAPSGSGLLVAAVGLERMDLLRVSERRG